MCMTLHFLIMFNSFPHLEAKSTRLLRALSASAWVAMTLPTLVSSANSFTIKTRCSIESSRSLMKTTKHSSPSTEPCGTPEPTAPQSDAWLLKTVLCCLSNSKLLIHQNMLPVMPWALSMSTRLLCGTLLKALA